MSTNRFIEIARLPANMAAVAYIFSQHIPSDYRYTDMTFQDAMIHYLGGISDEKLNRVDMLFEDYIKNCTDEFLNTLAFSKDK